MKRVYYILISALLLLAAAVSCTKESSGTVVDGEWYSVMTVGTEIVAEAFIVFDKGHFTIYQKTGSQQRYFIYEGTYTVTDGILSGRYDDGSPLGADYKVTVEKKSMTLEALNKSGEVDIYLPAQVPEEVKDNAVPHVKSVLTGPEKPL